MQFVDLAAQQQRIKKKIDANIQTVLEHGKYIMGPEVIQLEERLSDYTGTRYAIGCASGTDALLMALMAFDVGPGDAIFTTPFTFMATAETISLLGATPVFVDVDPVTFNMVPEHLKQAVHELKTGDLLYPTPAATQKLTPKGIVAVDLFGLPADYDHINAIAAENDLFVIEDAAQSFGAEYKGKKTCGMGHIGCTSFFPAKPLGCYGDGGMCFTDDTRLADVLRSIRMHGKGVEKYGNIRIGINGRLDSIQAAVLHAKFDIFPEEIEIRNTIAQRYSDLLNNPGEPLLEVPHIPAGYKSAWAQYSILARDEKHRSSLQASLESAGIPTAVYYPIPLHLQTAYAPLEYKEGDFPVSEGCSKRIFSLPMHPYLTDQDQKKIVALLKNG